VLCWPVAAWTFLPSLENLGPESHSFHRPFHQGFAQQVCFPSMFVWVYNNITSRSFLLTSRKKHNPSTEKNAYHIQRILYTKLLNSETGFKEQNRSYVTTKMKDISEIAPSECFLYLSCTIWWLVIKLGPVCYGQISWQLNKFEVDTIWLCWNVFVTMALVWHTQIMSLYGEDC